LDFYSDPKTRALYKLNIWGLLSRVNPLTGLAPKDDPTIFSFNIINEPRCPGAQCYSARCCMLYDIESITVQLAVLP
jgi:mannan endo-1,4-beta-mannosidase